MDQPHISGTAVIITGGLLHDGHAKTAHGLLRTGKRFKIIGVLDEKHAGSDAGRFVDGVHRGIPVMANIDQFIEAYGKPDFAVIGMATKGGVLPESLYASVKDVLKRCIHLVNGLHQPINEIDYFKDVLGGDAQIYDIRKSKPFKELHFWEGKVQDIKATKIAVLGMDCATGKRTTSRFLEEQLVKKGHKAEMIYTGQTGWMQGADYGLLLDATANDFITGELEHALYSCWKDHGEEILIIEGQSSLRNPSGPCGSELIISGDVDGVVLQHVPARKKFSGAEHFHSDIPAVLDEVSLIEKLGTRVIGITLNGEDMEEAALLEYRSQLVGQTDIPVIFQLTEDLDPILDQILKLRS